MSRKEQDDISTQLQDMLNERRKQFARDDSDDDDEEDSDSDWSEFD